MTTTVEATERGFAIVVEHGGAQSWSKAVSPRATKAAKAHMAATGIREAGLYATRCDWVDETKTTGSDRCRSTYSYEVRA